MESSIYRRITGWSSTRKDVAVCAILLLLWGVGIMVVGTEGNFPLNDDWAYARGVRSMVEEGRLELDQWPAMTLIAQIWVGIGYSEVFGFSFQTLRWSTLVNGYIGLVFFYLLLRRFTSVRMAIFAALVLLFNPLFYSLAFTFMTEVHFLMAILGSMYFFTLYVENGRYGSLLWAGLFSVFATLIRQPGVLVPLAFALVLLVSEKNWLRRLVPFLPFAVSFVVLKLYYAWLGNQFPDLYKVGGFSELVTALTTQGLESLTWSLVNMLALPGWWLFPLLILMLPALNWKKAIRSVVPILLATVLAVFVILNLEDFPIGNVFYNIGVGPKLLKGVMWGHENVEPRFGLYLWNCFKYVAVVGMVITLFMVYQLSGLSPLQLLRNKISDRRIVAKWGVALFYCAYFVITVSISSMFDRYTLHLVPALAILVIPTAVKIKFSRRWATTTAAILCLVVMALFSVAATHDYLSWNRARAEAYEYLTVEQGIPPTQIDAGFELNGWQQAGPDGYQSGSDKSWWFVTEDDYVIAFFPLTGFSAVKSYSWPRLLPPGRDSLYILEKVVKQTLAYDDFPILSDLETRSNGGDYFLTSDERVELANAELRSNARAHSGTFSIKLDSLNTFGLTSMHQGFEAGDTVVVSVWRYPEGSTAGIVIDSEGTDTFYELNNTRVIQSQNGWEQLESRFVIPPAGGSEQTSVYIWAPEGRDAWLDDLVIDRKPAVSSPTN